MDSFIKLELKKLPESWMKKFDLQEEGDFEIENIYEVNNSLIEKCIYCFDEEKEKISEAEKLENIIFFLFHYNEEKKIEKLINYCLQKNRKLILHPKIEQVFEYEKKIKACNDINYACENGYLVSLKIAHKKGCYWGTKSSVICAENGNLECLKYLHEKQMSFG